MQTITELRISPSEAKRRLDRGGALLLDVVQPSSWDGLDRVAAGAVRMAPDDVERAYRQLPRDRDIIAYCT